MQLRTVNIRALKDKLSAYLRDVQHGDILLITDRGKVVAEVRQPTMNAHAADAAGQRERHLIEKGELRPGLQNRPEAYRRSGVRLADAVIDDALAWTRGER
jgi:antitoxin (DNA-binding transcriptional repressor) of toxin-antitoxin stability system